MLTLFFKTALRSLSKRKGYALLNIFGLTLGMTCCLLIFKYVAYERSYDRFQKKASQVFRIQLDDYQNGQLAVKCAANYAALSPALEQDFPDEKNRPDSLKHICFFPIRTEYSFQ